MTPTIDELEDYFSDLSTHPKNGHKLSEYEVINDGTKFIERHLEVLRAQWHRLHNTCYSAYLDRILLFYNKNI